MIKPHGSDQLKPLHTDDQVLAAEAEGMPSLVDEFSSIVKLYFSNVENIPRWDFQQLFFLIL